MIRTLKPWPIIAGVLVDSVGSLALGILYVLVIFGMQILRGEPPGDDPLTGPHLVVIQILGLLLTALGGFAAAQMAKTLHVQHGIAVGVVALVVWLLVEWVSPSEGLPAWYEALWSVSVVPAGGLGGYAAAMNGEWSRHAIVACNHVAAARAAHSWRWADRR